VFDAAENRVAARALGGTFCLRSGEVKILRDANSLFGK
jgi:hypothetical protein